MKNILITGVSTGIGEAVTDIFIKQGFTVFGTLRNNETAQLCQKKWGSQFVPLVVDVRDEESLKNAHQIVKEKLNGRQLLNLVNNAGIVKPAPLELQPISELEEMLNVNVVGVLKVTQAFLPLMKSDTNVSTAKIINISSISGQLAAPFLGGYTASKFAIEGLSASLRRELMPFGIKVVTVAPGNVRTPIWKKASNPNFFPGSIYEVPFKKFIETSLEGEKKGLMPSQIAELIFSIVQNNNPKVRYDPVPQKFANFYVPKFLSHKSLDKMFFKMLGMKMVNQK